MVEFCFYACQLKITGPDRLYKIYVTHDALLGAWLAGELYLYRMLLANLVGKISEFGSVFLLTSKAKSQRESGYDRLISQPGQLLVRDQRNFAVPRSFICQAAHQPISRGLFGDNLRLEMYDGTALQLMILKPDSAQGVIDRLQDLGYFRETFAPSAIAGRDDDNPYRAPRLDW